MAKYSNTVEYNIRTTLDKTGLVQLQSQILQVENHLKTLQTQQLISPASASKAISTIKQVQTALTQAFNPKLGMLDNKALISSLGNIKGGINGIYQAFSAGGAKGTQAFSQFYGQLMHVDKGLKQVSSTSDKIFNTLGNTVRWGLIASAFASVMNAAHQSVEYVKDLDKSLTNIMMVSGETRDNMNEFARAANQVAQRLGGTTTQMTEATKIFVQQGLSLEQSSKLAEYSVHLANVSEQDSGTAADEITAYKNAFKIDLDDLGNAISKWAAVANNAAVSVEELSVASQKAASVAKTVGVDMDQFAAHIAAIESTTREAPENIGNGLKTLYSRISDIKLGETLEDGVNLGQFTGALKKIGVDALDASGQIRNAGEIIEDIMARWKDLSQTERVATATTVAGRFQLARFNALMNSADIYQNALNTSRAETGTETYDRMQETYRDSLEGRSKALTASIEEIFLNAFETDSFYGLVDATTLLTSAFGDLIKAVGGGGSALTAFAALLTKAFSTNIGRGIGNFIYNRQQEAAYGSNKEAAAAFAKNQLAGAGLVGATPQMQSAAKDIAGVVQYRSVMNAETEQRVNGLVQERLQLLNTEVAQRNEIEAQIMAVNQISQQANGKTVTSLEQALNFLRDQAGTEGEIVSAENLRAVGLGKITTQLENQQRLSARYVTSLQTLQTAGITSSNQDLTIQKEASRFLDLSKKIQLTDTQLKRLGPSLETITKASFGAAVPIENLIKAYETYNAELQDARINLLNLLETGKISAASMEGQQAALMQTGFAAKMNSRSLGGEQEQLAAQATGTSIVNVASSVMSLSFAWQSFQSLGSLWADDDIETGEKLSQTIMNLGMGLPMLIMGFTQLQTALGLPSLKAAVVNIQGLTAAKQKLKIANEVVALTSQKEAAAEAALVSIRANPNTNPGLIAIRENALTTAKEASAKATEEQAAAEAALKAARMGIVSIAMIGVTAAVLAGSMAWSAYTESIKQAKEAEKEAMETAAAKAEEIRSSTKNWDNLYEEYQKTGKASQELVDAGNELGKNLDIIGYKAQIAAGNFDSLAASIKSSREAAAEKAINEAQNLLEGKYGDSLAGKEWFNGSALSDYRTALIDPSNISAKYDETGEISDEYTGYAQHILNQYQAGKDASIGEIIGQAKAAQKALDEESQAIRKRNEELDKTSTEYKTNEIRLKELTDARAQLSKFLTMDDVAAADKALSTMFENRVSMEEFQNNLKAAGNNAKDIINVFSNDSITKEYFKELTTDAEKYAEALKYITNEAQRLNLMQAYSTEKIKGLKTDRLQEFSKEQDLTNSGIIPQGVSTEAFTKGLVLSAVDQVNQNQDLTLEEKEAILSSVDWTGPIEDILMTLAQGAKDDATAVLAGYKGMTDETVEAGGNLTSDQLKEYNLDQGTVDVYNEQLKSLGSLSEQNEYYTSTLKTEKEALDKLKKSEEATTEEINEQQKKVDDAQEALEDYNDETKDITAKMIQTQKGLEKLGKEFEENNDILKKGEKSTLEYAEAMSETKDALGDVLNVDPGNLTNGFIEEHLDEIQRLADGDLTALDELRMAFGQDYLLNLNRTGNLTDEELQILQADLENLDLTDVEVGAYVDDDAFVETLNQMMMDGKLTQDQVNQYLAGIGVEPEYETVPHQTTLFSTAGMHVSGDILGIPYDFELPRFEITGNVEVPQIKTSQSSGTGGHTGLRKTGGSSSGGLSNSYAPKSKGGGGGGGGGKSNEPKAVKKAADIDESKPAEAENDIYEKVNATLEKLQDSYSTLNKIKDRTWGKEYRDNAQKGLDLLVKEQKTLNKRIDIAKKYADALTTGKSNLEYGIDMTGKESLASLGLTDADADGVIDNYISKFEEARQAARKLDAEAEAYRNKANAEALAYWQSKGGVLDTEGNVITDASMSDEENEYYTELIEKQKTHYDLLVEKANEQWETAKNINDVTKDYEDTMNQIRDDEEEQLDIAHQIEDIQIDLYQRSLDMLDTMHDINDIAAQMKGFFTKLATDDPFRALTEGAQAFEDSFKDATYDAEAYYDDIIEKLKQEQDQVRANGGDWEKYNEAIAFYDDQKQKALTDADGLGSGELAQASRKLTELDRWIRNPNAVDNPYGTNTQALYDAYKEQYQKVTDAALEAEERMENVHDSILEAYDKMAEQQDEFIQKYDRVDEQLERTADRVALFKGEDAYADQAAIEEQRAKVALAAGRSNLKILDKYSQQLAKEREKQELERPKKIADAEKEVNRLQKALNKDKNNLDLQQQLATAKIVLEQAKYDDTEEVKWLQNKVDETSDYINDKADESAEHFKNAYENTIDELAAQTNEKVFGNRDLDLITNDWDWDRDYFGSYKDNVERTLETEKLRLKYLDLLDNAQGMSLGVQRQIKDAMDEQLALLENQKTVSEYDVKLANARLEILQKQIALENAQQNKNQMKLRRDTQGNYKYVYAADQGDVRQKQQELLDAEFDAYEMSKDANGDAYQKGIALYQQYIEQRTAIEKKYANDTDTMEKELAKLRENYLRAANANAEDLQDTYDGMIISVQWMAENGTEAVKQMTEDVLDALETKTQESLEAVGIPWNDAINKALTDLGDEKEGTGLIGAIDDTAQAGIDAAKRFVDAIDGDAKDINDDLGSVKSMVNDLAKSIDGDTAAIQGSFGDIEVSIGKAKQSTIELGAETDQLNQKLGAELGAVDAAKEKIRLYEEQLTAAKNSTSALASQLAETQEQLTAQTKEAEHWKTVHENYLQSEADKKAEEERKKEEAKKEADKKTNAKKTGSKNFGIGDTVYYDGKSAGYYTSYKDTPNWTWHNDAGWYEVFNMNNGMTALSTNGGADLWAWVENEHLTKYKTGGYTGIWEGGLDADDGRLAVLHQKELVLNQQDTKNILDAVQIVRSTLDLAKLSSLSPFTFGVGKISQGIGDRIEQRVEITAEFPAANSADDIRQALLGLSDAAMQYAYRER